MKERGPLNTGPSAILTAGRLGAGAVCKLKKTQSANKEYNWPQRRTRGETQSASSRPSVSLRCQRAGREKAEQKIKKYNKLKSLFFFLSPSRPPQKSKRNQEVVRRRGIALRKLAKI